MQDASVTSGSVGQAASDVAAQARPHAATPPLSVLEWRRKRTHMLPGLIPFTMWFIWHEDPLPAWNLWVATGVVAVMTGIAIRSAQAARRSRDETWSRTCVSYAVFPLLTLVLFPANAEFASVAVCVLAFGDAGAALGGSMWGRRPLPWNPEKTWVGLACFIVAATPLAILAYWGEARPAMPWSVAVMCGAAASVPAAIAETLHSRIDDNIRICLTAVAGVVIAHALVVGTVG